MNKLISIVIPTLNNESEITAFFNSIGKQSYPKSRIEIVAVDGGSTDGTLKQLKKYNAKIYFNKYILAEPGVSLGIEKARGDLIMIMAMDNFYYHPDDLQKMVATFENPSIYAAFPKQNYDQTDNLFTKYHNTFTDPFNHFVQGDAANARTFHRVYKTLLHTEVYDVYDFSKSKIIPMISFSQGFTLRGNYKKDKKDLFDDNKPVIELIKNNKKIAFVHAVSIYHHTIRDLKHFIKKQRWATQNALEQKNYGIAHRYKTLSAEQKLKIKLWPIYSLSIIFPLLNSLRGFIIDREKLWFFHPLNCLFCAYANFIQLMAFIIGKIGYQTKNVSRN